MNEEELIAKLSQAMQLIEEVRAAMSSPTTPTTLLEEVDK